MRNNKAKAARLIGGAGGGNVAVGTDGGKPLYSPSDVYYNHVEQIVNPFSGPIPTASGGPVAWAIADSLFALERELKARGLACPFEAIQAAYAKMVQEATYIPKRQRRAVLKAVGA